MIFDYNGTVISSSQMEHTQFYPKPGQVEHDPLEIYSNTKSVIALALSSARLSASDLSCVGVTNQRETSIVWSASTGLPYHNAIVWNDTRTAGIASEMSAGHALGADRFRLKTGLPLASYFSATKLLWLMRNVEGLAEALASGDALFGTVDTWLLWNLTGGPRGGRHVTDVTNASRTMLMNVKTLMWDDELLKAFGVPAKCLPSIRSSSEVYGKGAAESPLPDVPISGILGDQQAALFGQTCFEPGTAKCTYGTGQFLMMNTGTSMIPSKNGLLTTVGYKLGPDAKAVYALEGAVAYCGSVVQWLRDNLAVISSAPESESLATSVPDNGGMYFVPAFAGLFCPHWKSDARGTVCGMTAFNTKAHLCRAALEAAAYQAREVIDAMTADSGVTLKALQVDGGMTMNNFLMAFQSDILNTPVTRPVVAETTALGAAYAAGLAVGVWKDVGQLKVQWKAGRRWEPTMDAKVRDKYWRDWQKAVSKSIGWVDEDEDEDEEDGGGVGGGGGGGGKAKAKAKAKAAAAAAAAAETTTDIAACMSLKGYFLVVAAFGAGVVFAQYRRSKL